MKAETYNAPGPGPFDGTLALLWAILASGIHDYCEGLRQGQTQTREYRSARAWIFAGRTSVTSFESLCAIFDLDAVKIRGLLRAFEATRRGSLSAASLLRLRACSPDTAGYGAVTLHLPRSERRELDT